MNRIVFLILLCVPLIGFSQEEKETDLRAYKESRSLTREAGKDLESDDFVNAEAKYRRAIAKSAENAAAPYNLGNAYYEKESYSEAFGRFREAGERADEKPNKHKAYHNMGNVYMQRKEYEKAVEAYKEALRNDPTDEETRYNLALAKELLKKDPQQQQNDQNKEDQEQEDQQEKEEQNQDQDQGGEDQQEQDQDQDQQEGDSEKEENKEGDGPEKQEQQQKPNPSDQEEQKRPPRPNQLSPQQIENLLEAMENEEKKVKEKIDALKVKGPKVKKKKDW